MMIDLPLLSTKDSNRIVKYIDWIAMGYLVAKICHRRIIESNFAYIHHYRPDNLLLCCEDIQNRPIPFKWYNGMIALKEVAI